MINPIDINAKPEGGPADEPVDGQDDEQKERVKMVLTLLEEGKTAKKDKIEEWKSHQDSYDGKQWDENRPKYKASPVMNIGRQVVQTIIPILTDSKPKFQPEPAEPSDYPFADTLAKVTDAWWEKNNVQMDIVSWLYDSNITGTGILKIGYDDDLRNGEGDVTVSVLDPMKIYVPANATDFNKDCPWVIEEHGKRVGELKMMFPNMAHLIRADSGSSDGQGTATKANFSKELKMVSPVDTKGPIRPVTGSANEDNEMVTVIECWMDDHSVEEYVLEHKVDGGDSRIEKLLKKKYPRGKLVTILPNQKLELQCVENPYRDALKPYVRLVNTVKPRTFWGEGQIAPLKSPQQMANKIMGIVLDWVNYMGNPVWIMDKESGVDPEALTNQIGLIITKNQGTEVRRDWPTPLPDGILKLYQAIMDWANTVSGVHDVTAGRKPGGVTAAEAIYELQEAAQTRIRLIERHLNAALQQMGNMVVSRFMQYYKKPRVVKLAGDTEWPEFFDFRVEDVKGENGEDKYKFVTRKYQTDANGVPTPTDQITEGQPTRGVFDIRVSSGVNVPYGKSKRASEAFKLFEAGAIDDLELLKSVDWPNPEQVLERVRQRNAEKAQMEANAAPPPAQ